MAITIYLTRLKTTLVEATKLVFDEEYPEADFRDVYVSIEYPTEEANYPGFWVDFEPAAELHTAGVDHHEYTSTEEGNVYSRHGRWMFSGYATWTIAALSSFERDRLYDEIVRVLAFGLEEDSTSEFRRYIENNEFVACNFDFDNIGTRGFGASPGTPWGSDEIIYEVTISMECFGEFTSDGSGALVPLREILVYPYGDRQPDPFPTGEWM